MIEKDEEISTSTEGCCADESKSDKDSAQSKEGCC